MGLKTLQEAQRQERGYEISPWPMAHGRDSLYKCLTTTFDASGTSNSPTCLGRFRSVTKRSAIHRKVAELASRLSFFEEIGSNGVVPDLANMCKARCQSRNRQPDCKLAGRSHKN